MKDYMSIGQASKLLGMSIDTIRYYEKIKLIPPIKRRASGYRMIDITILLHLKGIHYLRQCGLTIDQIKDVMDNPSSRSLVIQDAVDNLDEKIKALEQSKRFLLDAQEELHAFDQASSTYAVEALEGYFTPLCPEGISLGDYLESDDLAWLISLDESGEDSIQGRFTKAPLENSLAFRGRMIVKTIAFENEQEVEAQIVRMMAFARQNGHTIQDKVLLLVYSKTSCFTGNALAGKLLIEIEREEADV